jgi:hypothetical protein
MKVDVLQWQENTYDLNMRIFFSFVNNEFTKKCVHSMYLCVIQYNIVSRYLCEI